MSTLDPRVDIPEGAPLAMAHDAEAAEAHRKANEQRKADVEAEAGQPEVGPRAAGDHAEKTTKKKGD